MAARILVSVLLSIMTFVQLPPRAFAWGNEGHRIIAEIAEQYIDPSTARKVRDLLAVENDTTVAQIANWADQIRRQRRDTSPWHYVDIPVNATAYNPARDCREGNCVVAKIQEFSAVLGNDKRSARERLEALKFLVHFVGDVHQPLHAADNGDRGGNAIKVEFLGRRTNLHAVWDTGILAPAVRGDERAYALHLIRLIEAGQLARWREGSPIDWANESHTIATRVIYGVLPHTPGLLPASYEQKALPIVNEQLEKAGVRLAILLQRSLLPDAQASLHP